MDQHDGPTPAPKKEELPGLDYAIRSLRADMEEHYDYGGRPEQAGMKKAVEILAACQAGTNPAPGG